MVDIYGLFYVFHLKCYLCKLSFVIKLCNLKYNIVIILESLLKCLAQLLTKYTNFHFIERLCPFTRGLSHSGDTEMDGLGLNRLI